MPPDQYPNYDNTGYGDDGGENGHSLTNEQRELQRKAVEIEEEMCRRAQNFHLYQLLRLGDES